MMMTPEFDQPDENVDIVESLKQFHSHRDQLRKSCDALRQPLARANDFLNTLYDEAAGEKREFFTSGFHTAEKEINNLFTRGVLGSSSPDSSEPHRSNPCIVVIGQTKAGKSSLINTLLKGDYVCQMDLACTARLTHLTYGEKLRVRCRHPDGRVDPWQDVDEDRIPAKLVQLSPNDRLDPEKVNVVVEAEVPSDFLRHGIDIYDSPGRNENKQLRTLTDDVFNSLIPMIIYVIDGRKQLTHEDVSDLDIIKRKHPTSKIFYVVTKLDLPKGRRARPMGAPDETRQAERTMETIRKALVERSCLPEAPCRSELNLIHGVSLLRVVEWRRENEGQSSGSPSSLVTNFERLQQELFRFISHQLKTRVISSANSLQKLAAAVLDGCVQKANSNVQKNFRSLRHLKVRQRVEEIIFAHLIHVLRSEKESIENKINAFLNSCKSRVLAKVPNYSYSDELEIPRNTDGFTADSPTIERCLEDLREFLLLCITTELRSYLEEHVLKDQLEALRESTQNWDSELGNKFHDLGDVVLQQQEGSEEDDDNQTNMTTEEKKATMHSFIREASAIILKAYWTALDDAVQRVWPLTVFGKMRGFFQALWRNFLKLFHSKRKANANAQLVDPHSSTWKKQQAEILLDRTLKMSIGEDICKIVLDHITLIHNVQQNQFAEEEALYRVYKQIAREDRQRIADLTQPFAISHLISTSVISQYRVRQPDIRSPLGVGSQGTVYKCTVRDEQGKEILVAMKQVLISDKFLAPQALEIFYTIDFNHPHLLPVEGVHYEHQQEHEMHRIRIFSPLMTTNCRNFLNKMDMAPLPTRLQIAKDVCSALIYLHQHGIIHRDIKLENVLLDDSHRAFVADFGLCKPVGLTNWSVVGSPIHMAPEIIDNALVSQNNRETVTYNEAVDIYAFGILMWYLVEGTGKHPEFVKEMRDVYDVLNASRFGKRPERPCEATDAVWELIEQCWNGKPDERPCMTTVEARLQAL